MIRLDQLSKVYGSGDAAATVLDRLDLAVDTGRVFAVVGPSGAGKSTLAQCVTLLEKPTSGRVVVNGDDLTALGADDLRVARRRIGTIFQQDGLFSRRTAADNVALPLQYLGVTKAETRARVAELLDRVGLADKAKHYPHQLSGGQRQRVGIARALALRPSVLLSDEATSGLDPDSTASIVRLLRELRDDLGLSILFITHEMDTVLQVADSVARLDHGRIVEQGELTALLRDPDSALGAQLRPARAALPAADGDRVWTVSYAGDVPGDWIGRLGARLAAPIALLGAAVEQIDGVPVGRASLGIPASLVADDVAAALSELGLAVRRAAVASSASKNDVDAQPAAEPAEPAADDLTELIGVRA
ncbi:methionine ABC transporter ATP-binding protein [Schumannella sp. 10F1B-5-1]|uniref:methionine ABC transporter ATP-binding protein n=1 Tax=Schumannella sp. 10F1B-5-1 TaxID=2590780 RepID=UPI0011320027|nr:ATP-binding cassette domain-containing protein [Schumannella sp. 10F1B-5-1]TPW71562.1 ATP-binding cassette domain-containing protein [Schumannella sp. 10F1B-5-1]